MKTKNKIIIIATLIMSVILLLCACGSSETELDPSLGIKDTADLVRGCYYIETDDGYYEPIYRGTSSYYDEERSYDIALFKEEDFSQIPTLYPGKHLVFRKFESFDENFVLTHYFDEGYTVGITAMNQTQTGRYRFSIVGGENSTAADDKVTKQVWEESDAWRLTELGDIEVTLEAIGGEKVRENMISECGTILGLEKDKVYEAEVYTGTEYQPYNLKADTRVLYEVQRDSTLNYRFIKKEVIEIDIPDYFESGYYRINDAGIFRYIAEEDVKWEDGMNINTMNPVNAEEAYVNDNISAFQEKTTRDIEITDAGEYNVTINVSGEINTNLLPDGITKESAHAPVAIINLGDEGKVSFEDKGNGNLTLERYFDVGEYTITIDYVYGRNCNISLYMTESSLREAMGLNNTEETTSAAEEETVEEVEEPSETEEAETTE